MSRLLRTCVVVAMLGAGTAAHAQSPTPTTPPSAPAPRPAPQGIAVLGAGPSSRDAAVVVARALYASRLRPTSLDEAHARVLTGDPPPQGAAQDLRDLSELRAAITGGDAASRKLLGSIAEQLGVRAILVVQAEPGTAPTARLFMADVGDLDAARYEPEPGVDGALAWRATVASLERRFAPAPSAPPAATSATPAPRPTPTEESGPKPFYSSAWFWAAVGGAALVGGAIYFASRDTTSDTIHLQMRLPR